MPKGFPKGNVPWNVDKCKYTNICTKECDTKARDCHIWTRMHNREYRKVIKADVNKNMKYAIKAAITNHIRNGYVLSVDKKLIADYLYNLMIETKTCRYCGIALKLPDGTGQSEAAYSLDDINNSKNLSIDNVQWICHKCNATKSSRSHKDFISYMKKALELNEEL